MIALDSSVVVRYLTQDDAAQGALAARFLEHELTPERPGFLPIVVVCEVAWVLRRGYGFPRDRVHQALRGLLNISQLKFAEPALVARGLAASEHDLPDFLIHEIGRADGCSETVTFDRRFARMAGVRLLGG